jgi:hypothetical protein
MRALNTKAKCAAAALAAVAMLLSVLGSAQAWPHRCWGCRPPTNNGARGAGAPNWSPPGSAPATSAPSASGSQRPVISGMGNRNPVLPK